MGTTVLVIDDEAPIRLLCRVNLEAEGMEVLEAADGPSGLEKAREQTPDVVLLDVMMPGLDGWRVAEELLDDERTEAIPIIFLTARAELRDRARGIDPRELSDQIGRAPDYEVVSDGRLVVEANNQGIPFVLADPTARVSQDLARMAQALTAPTAAPPPALSAVGRR